ncbi:ABC transporter substrate-binding protein [Desulfosarcina cetonica]|uniref:ABC transporter substrate-binding protein n=1 Tax=Desulfosarcina cetonica TaxID=90730 RepID=UPI001FF05A55|nr:ABC transporter substrate-binding protein [Desulfosarcina cetonica]
MFNAFHSLNPKEIECTGASWIFPLLFSTLARINPEGRLEPDLARSWHYDRENRTLRIDLRRHAKFHDGMPVTSGDVIFSIHRQIEGLFRDAKRAILTIDPISKHALKIVLSHDDPGFFDLIHKTMILPRHVSMASHRDHPLGSGPYRFDEKLDDQNIRLSAFHDYYGGRPAIEHVLFTHVTDMEQTWTRLLAGKTDIAVRLAPDNLHRMKFIQQRFHINQSPSWFCKTLLFNTADPRLADVRVRRALSLGIDRDHMVEKILMGYGRVATGPLGLDSPYGRSDRPPRPYDPVKARELLNDAGWKKDTATGICQKDGLGLEFDLLYMQESSIDERVVRFIQLCLDELGVRVRPVPVDYATFRQSFYGNTAFQAVLTETMGLYDSHTPLLIAWMPPERGCSNMGGFTSPRITELLMALEDAGAIQAQQAICQAVEDRLLALQPAAFLYQPTEIDVVSKRIYLPHAFAADTGSVRRLYQAQIRPRR